MLSSPAWLFPFDKQQSSLSVHSSSGGDCSAAQRTLGEVEDTPHRRNLFSFADSEGLLRLRAQRVFSFLTDPTLSLIAPWSVWNCAYFIINTRFR